MLIDIKNRKIFECLELDFVVALESHDRRNEKVNEGKMKKGGPGYKRKEIRRMGAVSEGVGWGLVLRKKEKFRTSLEFRLPAGALALVGGYRESFSASNCTYVYIFYCRCILCFTI